MKEKLLNILIYEYNELLKEHKLILNKENLAIKFDNIIQFVNENKSYEFKKSALSTESLRFLKERKINFKIEKTKWKEPSKVTIHSFINSENLLDIQNSLLRNNKNEQINTLKEVIILIEKELYKVINLEFNEMKKITKSNLYFAKKKKQVFFNLVHHFKLNNQELITLLNQQEFNYETLKIIFDLIENELNDSEIKAFDFLISILSDKKARKKLRIIV